MAETPTAENDAPQKRRRHETCWLVSCWNYGRSDFWCEHGERSGGMRGSEAGCYS